MKYDRCWGWQKPQLIAFRAASGNTLPECRQHILKCAVHCCPLHFSLDLQCKPGSVRRQVELDICFLLASVSLMYVSISQPLRLGFKRAWLLWVPQHPWIGMWPRLANQSIPPSQSDWFKGSHVTYLGPMKAFPRAFGWLGERACLLPLWLASGLS